MDINKLSSRTHSRLGLSGASFGIGLINIFKERNDIVVVTADMAKPAGLSRFMSLYPQNFYNVGIAEQSMLGIAAGISSEGYKSIVVAQACFVSMRSFEMLRQYMGYMKSNIIACGVGAGFALTYFGNTHYSFEDVAIIRSIPGITILSPSDASQAIFILNEAIKISGPVYIRYTGQVNSPIVYNENFEIKIGKAIKIKEGSDVTIFASGSMVYNSLKASEILSQSNISVAIYDYHTIKPLDLQAIKNSKSSRLFVSIEEHSIIGGLGSAISDFISLHENFPPLLKIGVNDIFSQPGDYKFLIDQNGLSPKKIANSIKDRLNKILTL